MRLACNLDQTLLVSLCAWPRAFRIFLVSNHQHWRTLAPNIKLKLGSLSQLPLLTLLPSNVTYQGLKCGSC